MNIIYNNKMTKCSITLNHLLVKADIKNERNIDIDLCPYCDLNVLSKNHLSLLKYIVKCIFIKRIVVENEKLFLQKISSFFSRNKYCILNLIYDCITDNLESNKALVLLFLRLFSNKNNNFMLYDEKIYKLQIVIAEKVVLMIGKELNLLLLGKMLPSIISLKKIKNIVPNTNIIDNTFIYIKNNAKFLSIYKTRGNFVNEWQHHTNNDIFKISDKPLTDEETLNINRKGISSVKVKINYNKIKENIFLAYTGNMLIRSRPWIYNYNFEISSGLINIVYEYNNIETFANILVLVELMDIPSKTAVMCNNDSKILQISIMWCFMKGLPLNFYMNKNLIYIVKN